MPPTRKGRRTRETLKQAARAVFGEKGFMNTRVTDVTERAGVSNGAFYRYFADKHNLLMTLLDDLFDGMTEFARSPWQPGDPSKSVYETTVEYFRRYEENADLYRVMIEASQNELEVEARWNAARVDFFQRIARSMRRGQEQGLVRVDVDPDVAAALLGGMTEHYAYLAFVLRRVSFGDSEHVNRQLVDIWAHGVFVVPDGTLDESASATPSPATSLGTSSAAAHGEEVAPPS